MDNVTVLKEKDPDYPLVSIIVPCYNGANYLAAFLDSVISQNYPEIEFVFIDDCSTDNTAEIVQDYKDRFSQKGYKFQYIHLDINLGAAAAINRGLANYNGSFLMWSDADDFLFPENVSEKVEYLKTNPDKDFVLCGEELVNEDDLETPVFIMKRTPPIGDDDLAKDLLEAKNVVYGPGAILVRRGAFEKAIPKNNIFESRQGQNYQLLLPLACCCTWGYINKPLMKYVQHPNSHSNQKRSYHERLERQKEFAILEKATLREIPGLSQERIEQLMHVGLQLLYGNELEIYLRYGKLLRYLKRRRQIRKEGFYILKSRTPLYYYGIRIKRRVINIFQQK